VWAVDFQFDVTADGRSVKIVSIIDEHTRECLGGMVERSVTGEHLIAELDRLAAQRGTFPAVLRCDNAPELACSAMADWAAGQVGLHFIPPGQPCHKQLLVTGTRPNGHQRLETNTTDAIPPSVTNHRPATLPPAFIDVRRMRPLG
jgi:Integrase core domain